MNKLHSPVIAFSFIFTFIYVFQAGVDVDVNAAVDVVPPLDKEFCDYNSTQSASEDYGDDEDNEPSFCQEVLKYDNHKLYAQEDQNILAALGTSVLNKTYPTRINTTRAFVSYDELPYPVPTGATSYFMVLFTVIFTWYFTHFLNWLLRDVAKRLDLFPKTDSFPNVNIYTLQQSRRESRLNRQSRNTWSWLATFFLVRPSDPNVNPDEVLKTSGWDDFQVPHDVWYIIKAVLRINAYPKDDELGKTDSKEGLQTRSEVSMGRRPNEVEVKKAVSHDRMDDRLLMLQNLLKKKEESKVATQGSQVDTKEKDKSTAKINRSKELKGSHSRGSQEHHHHQHQD